MSGRLRLVVAVLALAGLVMLLWPVISGDSTPAPASPPRTTAATSTGGRPASDVVVGSPSAAPARSSAVTVASDDDEHGWVPVDGVRDAKVGRAPTTAAEKAAVEVATRAAKALTRPARPHAEAAWRRQLAPLLTEQAKRDYATLDPYKVSYTSVRGPAKVVPLEELEADLLVVTTVSTNAGVVELHLLRQPGGWGVSWIGLPGAGR